MSPAPIAIPAPDAVPGLAVGVTLGSVATGPFARLRADVRRLDGSMVAAGSCAYRSYRFGPMPDEENCDWPRDAHRLDIETLAGESRERMWGAPRRPIGCGSRRPVTFGKPCGGHALGRAVTG